MPHVCGDEPDFYPRAAALLIVCPTYVGMNRHTRHAVGLLSGMPHVCGDEPKGRYTMKLNPLYAPRMWG